MSRGVLGASSLVFALVALGLAGGTALAQQPAGQADAPPGAKAAGARQAPGGHLWWNDEAMIATLSLTAEQRRQMDVLFDGFQKKQRGEHPMKSREAFHAALRQGKLDQARKELGAWVDTESSQVRDAGELKLAVLGLLTPEQRKQLQTLQPDLVGVLWVPRTAWKVPPRQQKAPAPR